MIPYGRQDITDDDVAAVEAVLRSDFLTQGPAVPRFEAAVARATGAAHGVAANSATSALHIACLALGLGAGDLMWTTPITFVATANVGALCGAEVDFVDIDPESFNMDPAALEAKLDAAAAAGRLPKLVIPVHMCGRSADMARIGAACRRHGVRVIEDASHAIGGRHAGAPVGAGVWSDITVFSFHPVKIVTTAEGGVAVTQDEGLAAAMERLRSHGVTRDPALMQGASEGPWYYQQLELGLNYRMTEMQAALGLSQMERLGAYVARRNDLADRYDAALVDLPVDLPGRGGQTLSAFHLYVIRVDPTRRRAIFEALRAAGIGVNVHYIPVHLQPFWRARGFAPGDFPVAEAYYARAISIPLYAGLSEADQDRVVAAIASAVTEAA
ncbi:UDP-4-amino-4,6-dideoxy-N-acetyl-beta-L-altrosamine transaminase [Mesobaculum littorinae]|uniref:UDP-4-amino-4, 6-dideoxy-N-acetyl-beta-L-altrosamine transaminase n=1 Tax=Mesobaculum littorinae TaxID=2486419 RepID=A0A438AJL1_9RHOB|nr:UDP-4-amino-4,6-dideoxy-N-acetyl-beta-L-altrosamine transaminase [Mesobaculum littorinae]RVV98973.1 UDP-4-amino-4,6-dideoxy-N-acetyl-beta-L-altrosamine transaminase [Mesobaculum littorinae]